MDKFTIADVVRAANDNEPATLKQGFHDLMLDKIRSQLELKRDEIMDRFYNDPEDIEDDELDNETDDEDSLDDDSIEEDDTEEEDEDV